jgi:hypothetical protein
MTCKTSNDNYTKFQDPTFTVVIIGPTANDVWSPRCCCCCCRRELQTYIRIRGGYIRAMTANSETRK